MSSELFINEYPWVLPRSLAAAIGLNQALMLQQIHFWSDSKKNKKYYRGRYWVYYSYKEWQRHFSFWSETDLKEILQSLEERKLVFCNVHIGSPYEPKLYTINYTAVNALITSGVTNNVTTLKQPENKKDMPSAVPSVGKTMLELWNEAMPDKQITPTTARERYAFKIFKSCFNKNLYNWKNFLTIILKSDFLMGKATGFKVSFDWAIKKDNVHNILEGIYSNNCTAPDNAKEDLIKKIE